MTGRSTCRENVGLKKGPWTPEEDQKLLAYIEEHGHGSWRALPSKAGLQRCGKSCRLRWTNYLRPDIKRGKFSLQEEQTIIQLHALLGNRWSAIATHLPKRTDNEIKNHWNTHLKKRLTKMGIDPVTHKPKNATLSSIDGPFKNESNLSHMAQWESARLEAEVRLVRDSKLRSNSSFQLQRLGCSSSSSSSSSAAAAAYQGGPNWHGTMWYSSMANKVSGGLDESPTSTTTFSDQNLSLPGGLTVGLSDSNNEFEGRVAAVKEERGGEELKFVGKPNHFSRSVASIPDIVLFPADQKWRSYESSKPGDGSYLPVPAGNNSLISNGFTELLINPDDHHNSSSSSDVAIDDSDTNNNGECREDDNNNNNNRYEQEISRDYWNNILGEFFTM